MGEASLSSRSSSSSPFLLLPTTTTTTTTTTLSSSRSTKSSSGSGQENAHPNIPFSSPLLLLRKKINNKEQEDDSSQQQQQQQLDPLIVHADAHADPSVKVVVRIRPVNRREREGVRIIRKLSHGSLSIEDHRTFAFDAVLGPDSSQDDVFKAVGIPLVKNSLAGFNTSILSYGQTGSGKTYTMWGPPSAMLDCHSINSYQGVVPRIFHMLFSEIQKIRASYEENQINYQCRCSFLEIYNEQINDLLDPTQRNLQIVNDDARNGCHVENLTDEYVTTVEDVTQMLVKGLSNRKVGATSMNSKSSRSHIIFICTIESWCKGSSSKFFSSSKTSRITLVDLAGLDRDKVDDVSRHIIKEGRHVKQSLSKLGKVINILAETDNSGNYQKIPYMSSCLTRLLQDTLGGNSKITFICAISPNDRHRAGTLSTLRFGEKSKLMKNKAVINEITEDHVNGLSDQIKQLKEELIKTKSYGGNSREIAGACFNGKNARDSLNLLRVSLNRSLILPHIDNDSEEELDVDEDEVLELCSQLSNLPSSLKEKSKDVKESINSRSILPAMKSSNAKTENGVGSYLDGSFQRVGAHDDDPEMTDTEFLNTSPVVSPLMETSPVEPLHLKYATNNLQQDTPRKSSRSIAPSLLLPFLQDPTVCSSPKIDHNLNKSIIRLSSLSTNKNESESLVLSSEKLFTRQGNLVCSSLQSSKICPTEYLAASLHRGLQIIDYHQQSSAGKRTLHGLPFEHLPSFSCQSGEVKADAGAQTSLEDGDKGGCFLCSACKRELDANGTTVVIGNSDTKIAASTDTVNPEIAKKGLLEGSTDGAMPIEELKSEVNVMPSAIEHEYFKENHHITSFDMEEREALVKEIESLKKHLNSYYTDVSKDGCSLLDQIRNGSRSSVPENMLGADFEEERRRWTESESRWISLTEELRVELETIRKVAERKDTELNLEKKCTVELDDALQRSILGHVRMIEQYVELQEKHNDLVGRYRKVMDGIAEVKKAACRAGSKKNRSDKAFAAALAAEMSSLRIEKERERAFLKEQNKGLRIQLRDTAEAVHAAGELLVRLREAEEAVSLTEKKYGEAQQENEKLRKQAERMKKKHAMEMATMKHYLAQSRLPGSALEPLFRRSEDNSETRVATLPDDDDDQPWRAAFTPSYQ